MTIIWLLLCVSQRIGVSEAGCCGATRDPITTATTIFATVPRYRSQSKQVCRQLHTSAVNVTLLASAAVRRAAAAVDRYLPWAGRSAANPPYRRAAGE